MLSLVLSILILPFIYFPHNFTNIGHILIFFPTSLVVDLIALYPILVSVIGRCFFFYYLTITICRLWRPLTQVQGITYLYRYKYVVYTVYWIPT